MRTGFSIGGRGLSSTVTVIGVVALLCLAPLAWAAPDRAPTPEQGRASVDVSWIGTWADSLFQGIEKFWEAQGCGMDPDGTPCAGSTTTVETQDGETCDPTTTEMGCGMDPNG